MKYTDISKFRIGQEFLLLKRDRGLIFFNVSKLPAIITVDYVYDSTIRFRGTNTKTDYSYTQTLFFSQLEQGKVELIPNTPAAKALYLKGNQDA